MDKNESNPAKTELPENIRRRIDAEIESGLEHFRRSDFDVQMRVAEALNRVPVPRPIRSRFKRWAPALTAALAAAVLALVVLLPERSPAPVPSADGWIAALERTPGIQSLNRSLQDKALPIAAGADSPSPLLRGLAGAAASAPRPAGEPIPPVLVPRYDLQRKIEILIKERPIERALAWIKFKTREV